MKREGRQHGMISTHRILPSPWKPRPHTKFINKFDSPPYAGLFTKVQPKPTNHSKFTGKCGRARCNECHTNPCCKSKEKAKGNQKLRSHDVVSNYKLIAWRVVDSRPGSNFSGFSATDLLDHLAEYDDVDDEVGDCVSDYSYDAFMGSPSTWEIDAGVDVQEIANDDDKNYSGDDDNMSFCDVGFLLDQVEGEEDWCFVADM